MSDAAFRPDAGAEMLMFWEKGRVMYNAVLALIVIPHLGLVIGLWPAFLAMALVANALYCAAYPLDILMQHSAFAAGWTRAGRWVVLLLGTVIAAGLAASVMVGPMGFLGPGD